jgi:C4-dicarboxylate transporter DctQ subunit
MSYVLRKIETLINGLTHVGSVLGGIFTGVMTFMVTYAVVMRYAFNRPIGWSEEISIYLMIWAAFLGAAYALKEDAHIGVDLLLSRLPEKIKPCFLLFHCVVGLIFCSILFFKGLELVKFSIGLNNRSIAIDFPLFIPQLAVPVGSAILFLQFLAKAGKLIPGFRRKTGSI